MPRTTKSTFDSEKKDIKLPLEKKDFLSGVQLGLISLEHPYESEEYGTSAYNVQILLHKEDDADLIEALEITLEELVVKTWGDDAIDRINDGTKKEIYSPLRDGLDILENSKSDSTPEWIGDYMVITPKNKKKQPLTAIFREGKTPLTPEHKDFDWDDIYPGCRALVSFQAYTWDAGGDKICLTLKGVMKVADGERTVGEGKPTIKNVFGDAIEEMGGFLSDDEEVFGGIDGSEPDDIEDDLDDDDLDDDALDDEPAEVEEKPAKRTRTRRTKAKAETTSPRSTTRTRTRRKAS